VGASVNKCQIIGNLGADPKMAYTQTGVAVCNFSVALPEVWNDKDGNKQERVEWARVSVWGKQGELCGEYLSKGRQVYVEGKLKTTEYEKNGEKRYSTQIVASSVQFLGSKDDAKKTPSSDAYSGSRPKSQQQSDEPPAHHDEQIDDVPF
jgi:single-strand DNA-binding protein